MKETIMTEQKEIIAVDPTAVKEVSIFEKTANDLQIKSAEDVENAVDTLGSIKKMQKSLKEKEDLAKKPFQETLNGIRDAFKPININLTNAESVIKGKIMTFRSAEAKKVEEQKAKIEGRVGDGKGKLKVQTAINQISSAESSKSAGHINTGNSTMTVRLIKKLEIINEALIPREFLVVDTTKVRASAFKIYDLQKEGVKVDMIPGIKVTEEESIGAR
jgi:hypothetical protein